MSYKFQKSILAGIIGAAVMSMVTMMAPLMGMPRMSPPQMLSGMLSLPVFMGWVMHFMTGIVFALAYTYLFAPKVKIENIFLKGAVFGVIIFIFAQAMMFLMGAMITMPKPDGSMILMMIGGLMGHLIFGIAVAKTSGNVFCENKVVKQVNMK